MLLKITVFTSREIWFKIYSLSNPAIIRRSVGEGEGGDRRVNNMGGAVRKGVWRGVGASCKEAMGHCRDWGDREERVDRGDRGWGWKKQWTSTVACRGSGVALHLWRTRRRPHLAPNILQPPFITFNNFATNDNFAWHLMLGRQKSQWGDLVKASGGWVGARAWWAGSEGRRR